MREIKKKLILVVLLAAGFLVLWKLKAPQEERVSLAQTSAQAAQELLQAREDGQDSLLFYSPEIEEKEVFHLLQAREPYLATLDIAHYDNGQLELTYTIPHKKEQNRGLESARMCGAQAAEGQTDITDKLEAIHDALVRSCVYAEDAGDSADDRNQMAAGAVEDGSAVCGGYARAFQAMCDGAGLDVYYIEDDDMSHAWNAVRLYGETYFIDCTYDDPLPDRGDWVSREYFMLTADQLRETHSWNEELYEQFLDEQYPENFAYIQRMQDLQLADQSLRAADTDRPATQQQLDTLNQVLNTTLAESVVYEVDGEEKNLTNGELYFMGYEALWEEVDGTRRIEQLIDAYIVPVLTARSMGF